jgi:hypothetical protein
MTDTLTASLPIRNDPWYQICLRAQLDKRFERVRDEIIEGRRAMEEGRMVYNMDGGPYFHDTRAQSIITAPCTSVTGASTDKLLWPGSLTAVPAGYFTAGKKLRLTAWVSVTTGVTPANGGIELYVGSADAGGTLVASSAPFALVGSQSTMPFLIVAYLKCNGGAVESAKPVEGYARWECPIAVCTSANQSAASPIPITAPAAVNIDNTLTTLGFNIQMKNSGANANTYVTRDIIFEALT